MLLRAPITRLALAIMFFASFHQLSTCSAQELPTPTGKFRIGHTTIHLATAQHPYLVHVWYPAQSQLDATPSPYISPEELQAGLMAPGSKKLDSMGVHTHAREGVPVAKSPKRFPVLLLAAGSTSLTQMYSSLMEELASRGYVVIGYGPTVIGGGTWQGDLMHVLDMMKEWNSSDALFRGRLDLDHVGGFGHSAGGSAIATIAATDRRLKAIVVIDPGAVRPEDGPPIPVLVLKSENSDFAKRYPDIVEEKGRNQDGYALRAHPGLQMTVLGAVHLSFTDMSVLDGFNLKGDGQAIIATTRAVLVAFFDRYLEGKATDLFTRGSAKYPLARVDTGH